MPKFNILSNLLRTAIKTTTTSTTTASDTTFKCLVTHFESITPPKPKTSSKSKRQPETKPQSPPPPAVNSSPGALGVEDFYSEIIPTAKDMANDSKNVLKINSLDLEESGQVYRFDRLVDTCAFKLGIDATMDIFGMLGRETGLKECNALMKMCIEQCWETNDENVAMEQISQVLELFILMKDQGFPIEEESYGPFLTLLIDKGMVEEFYFFYGIIKDTNPSEIARLGYYDMRLYIRVNDEEKVKELCNCICTNDGGDENINLRENYLLALCECDQKNYLFQLLETVDITTLSSLGNLVSIFKSLGRLSLESYVEKFLLVLKNCDYGAEDISTLIFSYATSIPNLAVEDVVSKFKTLHTVMEMSPSSTSYERLIVYSCNLLQVHHAIDIVEQLCDEGFTVSINTIHSMLNASEANLDFNLVQRIYSLIYHLGLTPTNETFRRMIHLSVKMKDFDGAFGLLNDLKKLNLTPTASMYNAIMDGYFQEKNISGAIMVLEQMELAGVKPDSATYSCLISNCGNEDQITKCYEEKKVAGIQVSKQVYMELIDAYAKCGQFEKAKQVTSM
ncbi:hypothetical protein OIU77_008802 [Salix suchowensis]|uniref:Pentatricopeptide repeat-containing protein n=1 Tax=Salix suchowensis TaxID=1278906 RepID=A0ABQ9ACG3_9ROSI|nr:hypothetical protein OIU77_008802 [Salix suchowensis]